MLSVCQSPLINYLAKDQVKTEDNSNEQKPKENNGDLTEMPLEVKLEPGEDQNHFENDDQYFSETNPEDLESIEDSKEFIVKESLSETEEPLVKKRGRKRKIKIDENNDNETEAVKSKQTVCNHVEKAFPFYRLIILH